VSAEELLEARKAFPLGRYPLRIESCDFALADYHKFVASIDGEAKEFKRRQQAAFDAERERWAATGKAEYASENDPPVAEAPNEDVMPEGCQPVRSPITASVWNVAVAPGQRVEAGQKLIVLEAMKMEIVVAAPRAGVVEKLMCAQGALVSAGQSLVSLRGEVAA